MYTVVKLLANIMHYLETTPDDVLHYRNNNTATFHSSNELTRNAQHCLQLA